MGACDGWEWIPERRCTSVPIPRSPPSLSVEDQQRLSQLYDLQPRDAHPDGEQPSQFRSRPDNTESTVYTSATANQHGRSGEVQQNHGERPRKQTQKTSEGRPEGHHNQTRECSEQRRLRATNHYGAHPLDFEPKNHWVRLTLPHHWNNAFVTARSPR